MLSLPVQQRLRVKATFLLHRETDQFSGRRKSKINIGFGLVEGRPTGAACLHRPVFTYELQMQSWKRIGLPRRGSLSRASEKDHRQREEGEREGRREGEEVAEKVRKSVKGRGRHRGGAMREKVCGREADRKSEKSDMAESLCCLPLSLSPPSADGGECKTESTVGIWGYQQSREGLGCEGS